MHVTTASYHFLFTMPLQQILKGSFRKSGKRIHVMLSKQKLVTLAFIMKVFNP